MDFIYDPDKNSIDKDITFATYIELKNCADLYFIDNLKEAITTAKIILNKDLSEIIDHIVAYHDSDSANHLFSHAKNNDIFFRPIDILIGVNAIMHCSSFSNNGKFISIASYNNDITTWDRSGKNIILINSAYNAWIKHTSFSHDDKLILTNFYRDTAILWLIPPAEFYDYQSLFSYDNEEAKLWLILKHLLITYLMSIGDEKPDYQNFISHASLLMSDNDLAYLVKFILAHEHLALYCKYLFKDWPY